MQHFTEKETSLSMFQSENNFARRIRVSRMDLNAREYLKIHINTGNIQKRHVFN